MRQSSGDEEEEEERRRRRKKGPRFLIRFWNAIAESE